MIRAAVVLFVAAVGCADQGPLIRRTDDPMFYLVLTKDPLVPFDTVQYALLGTTGAPTVFEYRSAEQFEMRRASDGALFDWIQEPPQDSARFLPVNGNYAMAASGSSAGLGRSDLEPGETYTIFIRSGGETITGRARIPEQPAPVVVSRNDTTILEWPRVQKAAGYLVNGAQFGQDTFFVVGRTSGSLPPALLVTAVDSNWARFMSDTGATSVGVVGARGLFGAMSTVSVRLRAAAVRRNVGRVSVGPSPFP